MKAKKKPKVAARTGKQEAVGEKEGSKEYVPMTLTLRPSDVEWLDHAAERFGKMFSKRLITKSSLIRLGIHLLRKQGDELEKTIKKELLEIL